MKSSPCSRSKSVMLCCPLPAASQREAGNTGWAVLLHQLCPVFHGELLQLKSSKDLGHWPEVGTVHTPKCLITLEQQARCWSDNCSGPTTWDACVVYYFRQEVGGSNWTEDVLRRRGWESWKQDLLLIRGGEGCGEMDGAVCITTAWYSTPFL